MVVGRVTWGLPDFGPMVGRDSLVSHVNRSGRPLVLTGLPGSGKTSAMSQIAAADGRSVAWVWDCGDGASIAALVNLARGIVVEAESVRGIHDGLFIALDDVRLPPSESFESLIDELSNHVGHPGIRIALTTSMKVPRSLASRGCSVIDDAALAFDFEEAVQLVADLEKHEIQEHLHITHGHVGCMLRISDDHWRLNHAALELLPDRIIEASTEDESHAGLLLVCLFGEIRRSDVALHGLENLARQAEVLADRIPLIGARCTPAEGTVLTAHASLAAAVMGRYSVSDAESLGLDVSAVLRILALQARWADATRVARWACPSPLVADWLDQSGADAIGAMGHAEVLTIIERMPMDQLLSRPRLMLSWATALHEAGMIEESLGKSAVALMLADQANDTDTAMRCRVLNLRCLLVRGDMNRCLEVAGSIPPRAEAQAATDVRCELRMEVGFASMIMGRLEEGRDSFEAATKLVTSLKTRSCIPRRCARLIASLDPYWTGDWVRSATELKRLAAYPADGFTEHAALTASTAIALMEAGRISRASRLLASVLYKNISIDAAYIPFMACVQAGQGESMLAMSSIEKAVECAEKCGDSGDVNVTRVIGAMISRVAGRTSFGLDMAEQAYECLCGSEYLGFSELARCEVAACLVELGDATAARTWLAKRHYDNPYHGLRASMILAECDRRDGDPGAGIDRLARFADHIRSENSNWQMAMYIRTFPHLLGMLAVAAGAKNLPAHMLRMVLPENADRCLRASKSLMEPAEFELLGRRLLGDEQFAEFVSRRGRPLCRVRMFGGLEVTAGDRQVGERDWSKRKARLLFAMLVARRGHDVSRDTILDHLWPEMDEERAKNNFYVAWSSMKSALMPPETRSEKCPYVENVRGRCRVIAENVRSDVDEFEELIAKARAAESEDRAADARDAYTALVLVYRGDLLPGDLYDDWFSTLRDKYRFEFVEAMLRAARLSSPSEAIVFLRHGLDVDPFREDLYQASLKCQIESGRRSAAIETFIQCKTQLAEELGLDPSSETIALYQQVLVMEENLSYHPYDLDDDLLDDR